MAEKNPDVDSSGAPEDTATKPSAETMRAGEKMTKVLTVVR